MGFLDGLLGAGLKLYGGYAQGQMAGEEARQKRDQAEAERRRQQQLDAVRMALEQAQMSNYESEAAKRNQPAPDAPRYMMDGTGQIVAITGTTAVPVTGAKPRPIVPKLTQQARPLTAGQSRTAAQQEAEGMAYLGSNALRGNPAGRDTQAQFGEAFQAIRAQHPDWSPGRVAYAAKQGMAKVQAPKVDAFAPPAPAAIGASDLSGARDLVKGMDPSHATAALLQAGYTNAEIKSILGGQ